MIAPHRVYKLPIRDARSWTSPMGCSKGAPQHISLSLDTSLSSSHSLHLSFTSPRMASTYISRYIFHSINYNSDLSHLVATNPICMSKQKSKGQDSRQVRIMLGNNMPYITIEHFIWRSRQKINSTAEQHEGKEWHQAGGEGHTVTGQQHMVPMRSQWHFLLGI